MAKNTKLNKDEVIQIINEESHIITRKVALFKEIQKIEAELKNLNECMGLNGRGIVGSMGFKNPTDATQKSTNTGFVHPMNISHLAQLAQDMGMDNPYGESNETNTKAGGFGDEINPIEESAENTIQENERLKKELSELKAMLGTK